MCRVNKWPYFGLSSRGRRLGFCGDDSPKLRREEPRYSCSPPLSKRLEYYWLYFYSCLCRSLFRVFHCGAFSPVLLCSREFWHLHKMSMTTLWRSHPALSQWRCIPKARGFRLMREPQNSLLLLWIQLSLPTQYGRSLSCIHSKS